MPTPLAFAADAPPLTTYDTTFVFKQGKDGVHKIHFKGIGVGADTVTFLRLTIPKFAQFVDAAGKPLPDGSTVNLTVHVDRNPGGRVRSAWLDLYQEAGTSSSSTTEDQPGGRLCHRSWRCGTSPT